MALLTADFVTFPYAPGLLECYVAVPDIFIAEGFVLNYAERIVLVYNGIGMQVTCYESIWYREVFIRLKN